MAHSGYTYCQTCLTRKSPPSSIISLTCHLCLYTDLCRFSSGESTFRVNRGLNPDVVWTPPVFRRGCRSDGHKAHFGQRRSRKTGHGYFHLVFLASNEYLSGQYEDAWPRAIVSALNKCCPVPGRMAEKTPCRQCRSPVLGERTG